MAAGSGAGPTVDEALFRAAARRLFREQGFTAASLAHPRIRALVEATAGIFAGAASPALESGVVPEGMARRLREDIFLFSGFKTYRELKEAAALLRDKEGVLKSFDRFYKDITAINEKYNRHWLHAEYLFAQASAEMAERWADFEQDGDGYNLQYRTADDEKVRHEHRPLHLVTLPPSDPFWDEFFPPNGWNCFVAGTPILAVGGWTPIESVKKGDLVIGGSGKLRKVIGVHAKTVDDELASISSKGTVTTCTKNHRFCTPHGWVKAESLEPGDIVIKPGKNTPFHLLVNAINNTSAIIGYAFVPLVRKRESASPLAIYDKLKAWYKEVHDVFSNQFAAFKWKPLTGPLGFHGLTSISGRDAAKRENTLDCTAVDLPVGAQPPVTTEFRDIPEFGGIDNIQAFDGFHSFFDFLRKTFFHNRYVLVECKLTQKRGVKKVYNLSVDTDESYVVPVGIAHNCRCTAVQVRKGKYPESDSHAAIQMGREATFRPGKDGVNRDAIFRYNPGKEQVIFPPHHPYYEVDERERKAVREALYPEESAYATLPTAAGRLRIHSGHGKGERKENIRVASYFTDKYGYEIDLLDNPDGVKSADSFNRTLGYEEEYKVNQKEHPTKSSIDNLLRKAKEQANHIVLWIDSDISLGDLRDAVIDRVRRSESIKGITIVLQGKDCSYTREQIIKDGFTIKQADLK